MLGYILDRAHIVFQAITQPIRERRAISALNAVSEAKDAYRRAKVRGDTRTLHDTAERLLKARNEQLRAELGR
jgi:hypothetical protein